MLTHKDFHFSVTVLTEDLAILHCLRGLSMHAQKEGNKRIPWGGTKETDWEHHHHHATFHFTSPLCRKTFEDDAARLLPVGSWTKIGESDENPATPQAGRETWY